MASHYEGVSVIGGLGVMPQASPGVTRHNQGSPPTDRQMSLDQPEYLPRRW
jgi:hypothetical protein